MVVEGLLPVAEGMLLVVEGLLPVAEGMLPVAEGMLSVAERMLSVAERMLSVAERMLSVAERMLSVAEGTKRPLPEKSDSGSAVKTSLKLDDAVSGVSVKGSLLKESDPRSTAVLSAKGSLLKKSEKSVAAEGDSVAAERLLLKKSEKSDSVGSLLEDLDPVGVGLAVTVGLFDWGSSGEGGTSDTALLTRYRPPASARGRRSGGLS